MMKDAQQVFRHQPAIKKQFGFSNIVSAYENKNAAGKKAPAIESGNKSVQNTITASEDVVKDNIELAGTMKNVA